MMRAAAILTVWVLLTLLLLPVQLAALALKADARRSLPRIYHRILCRLIGVRIHQEGRRTANAPLLLLANHISWLDICIISATTPVVFVAKSEVARWPVFGWLAKLQRTIFVERERRQRVGEQSREIGARLIDGDAVVLFAEGTSGDGQRVLPFRSALVGAVHHALAENSDHSAITVQPLSIAYVGLNGLPVGRMWRDRVAWYGDAGLMSHLIGVLSSGAIDVTLSWGEARAHDARADRKQITREAETAVRRMTVTALRRGPVCEPQTAVDDARILPGIA